MVGRGEASGIRTTEVVFDIVESIRTREGATLAEITDDVDRAKSTIYAHLSTLVALGYVRNEGNRYRLGLAFLDLGTDARRTYRVFGLAKPKLDQLALETGERVQLMVEDDGRGVYLYRAMGERAIPADVRLGAPRYLHLSSAGKAILADLPADVVAAHIDRWGLPTKTPHTVVDRGDLSAELETIRERGYAINRQESIRGSWSIGVAIRHEAAVLGAISLSAPVNRVRDENGIRDDLLTAVRSTVDEIEIEADLER